MNNDKSDPFAFPDQDFDEDYQMAIADEESVSDTSSCESDATASPPSPEISPEKDIASLFPFWQKRPSPDPAILDTSDEDTCSELSLTECFCHNSTQVYDTSPMCQCVNEGFENGDFFYYQPGDFQPKEDFLEYPRRRFGSEVENISVTIHPFLNPSVAPLKPIPRRLFQQLAAETRGPSKAISPKEQGFIARRSPKKSYKTKPSQVLRRERDKLKRTLNGKGIIRIIDRF
jgi:hypothetical protein